LELGRGLDHQPGLRFDQQLHPQLLGERDHLLEPGIEPALRLRAGDPGERPAGRHRYAGAPQALSNAQTVAGVADADLPSLFFGLDPGGQIGVAHGKQREAVQIGHLEAAGVQGLLEPLKLALVDVRRVEVGPVGHDLHSLEPQARDSRHRVDQRKLHKGVGAVPENHTVVLAPLQ
jgi:hypothetical protein